VRWREESERYAAEFRAHKVRVELRDAQAIEQTISLGLAQRRFLGGLVQRSASPHAKPPPCAGTCVNRF